MKRRWLAALSAIAALVLGSGLSWAQQPRYGGTLRVALPGDPAFYNAHQGPAMGAQAFWTSNNIYNSLLASTPPPELQIVPELAKSWEVLDEGKTYVFHLQEGVTFHDGTDFDAEAAKWNIQRILDPEVKSWIRPYYEDIEHVEAVDRHTLRIRLKEPSAALPLALGGYYQGILMTSPKAVETYGKDWVRHPVGTGPFKFKEWVPGERVVLERNPQYFKKGLPYLDRLEYRVMKDPLTASTALRAGEIDFFARVPMQQVPILEKTPGIRVVTGLEMAPTIGFLNMRVQPFDDLRARRAVGGYGIDRGEIARVAFQGRAKPLVSVLAPGVQDAIDLNELYPYRPEEAKRLLQELGFDAKKPLRFTILISNQDVTMADVAALVKNQLARIGVQANIQLVDAVTLVDRVLVKHDFEMVINNWATLRDINQRSVSFFKGRQSDYMGIDDPQLEAMVLQWRRTMDAEGRRQLSAEMQRRLADQLEWVNLTTYPFFQAYRTYVKNYPYYEQALVLFEQVWLER